ncbi:MAG: hypothetical protein WCQ99_12460 [Pseudomonadota bacterium]
METICSTDADKKAAAEKAAAQDIKDVVLSARRPLHLIERFCQVYEVCEADEKLPQWMMNALYHGFACYLGGEGKKNMEACFKITPGQFSEKLPVNMDEMMESYAMLKYLFGMTHDKTAAVVKLWYSYPHDADTLAQQFMRVYQPACFGDDWTALMEEEMTVPVRGSQFLEKIKVAHPSVFDKLKKMKSLFKRNKNHPLFK